MYLVIDLVLLAIIIIAAIISAKYGFARSLIEFIGLIIIIVAVNFAATPIAEICYDAIIKKDVVQYKGSDYDKYMLPAQDFIDSLPDYLKNENSILSVDLKKVTEYYDNNIKDGGSKIATSINDNVIRPSLVKVLSTVISFLLIVILSILLYFLAKFLNGIIKRSFAKKINRNLGFILGLLKGSVIVLALCMILIVYVDSTDKGIWFLTADNINGSYFIKLVRASLSGVFN